MISITKMINVNGCDLCGKLERGHGQRYDSRYHLTVHGYVAPSDAVRKARLVVNRFNRTYPDLVKRIQRMQQRQG